MAIRQKKAEKRIEELERRVRELEARPVVYPAIVIRTEPAPTPYHPPWTPWVQPIWYVDHSTLPQVTVTTSGVIS